MVFSKRYGTWLFTFCNFNDYYQLNCSIRFLTSYFREKQPVSYICTSIRVRVKMLINFIKIKKL